MIIRFSKHSVYLAAKINITMNKIISAILLLGIITIFSCKDKDDEYVFPYTGKWGGTYSGRDNGTWNADISADGKFTGTAASNLVPQFPFNITGTVSNSGKIEAEYTYLTYTVSFNGQIEGTNASGT